MTTEQDIFDQVERIGRKVDAVLTERDELLVAAKGAERLLNIAMVLGQISSGTENSLIANQLRAAIAKAEGRQS